MNEELNFLKEEEEKSGVKITIKQFIDKNHLDCIWYGGEVASISYKGYTITIGAYGDIILDGRVNGRDFYVKDKENAGWVYNELGSELDDERFYALADCEPKPGDDFIDIVSSNWFEVNLIDPDGNWIDLGFFENVLQNNLLDNLHGVSEYTDMVDEYIKEVRAC